MLSWWGLSWPQSFEAGITLPSCPVEARGQSFVLPLIDISHWMLVSSGSRWALSRWLSAGSSPLGCWELRDLVSSIPGAGTKFSVLGQGIPGVGLGEKSTALSWERIGTPADMQCKLLQDGCLWVSLKTPSGSPSCSSSHWQGSQSGCLWLPRKPGIWLFTFLLGSLAFLASPLHHFFFSFKFLGLGPEALRNPFA